MMKMLEAGGIPPVTDGHRRADPDNPLGYYELEVVKQLPAKAEWLQDAGGKAVKVISALLEKLPGGYNYRVIFMEREMEEVLASQRQMLVRRGEYIDHSRDAGMGPMFQKHVASALERARARKDMKVQTLRYAGVHEHTEKAIEIIDNFLSGDLDRAAMAAVINPELWRQKV